MVVYRNSHVVMLLFFTLLWTITCSSPTAGHAFIQTDNELRFMIDGIPLPISTADSLLLTDRGTVNAKNGQHQLQFIPSLLDFDSQPVGMPMLRHVTVLNSHSTENLHLHSISGSTQYFHCSFFRDKVVLPGANTTFDIVFLARQVGHVEHALKIQTSNGLHLFQVFGTGIENPYRLRPLVGARVPVNSSYSPVIMMHNPFSQPLSVVEMVSSGGNLHLELPIPSAEATKQLWEIKPFETKPLMRATLIAQHEVNETGYIRIRTSSKLGVDDLLIVPLEVHVSSEHSLYTPQSSIDFGVVHSYSEPKRIPIFVINNSNRPIDIEEITLTKPNRALSVDYEPIRVPPNDVKRLSQIGVVTFHAKRSRPDIDPSDGFIILKGTRGERLTIAYTMTMLRGTLSYDDGALSVHCTSMEAHTDYTRLLSITNTFRSPIVIYNTTVPYRDKNWLSISKLPRPLTVQPKETVRLTKVTYNSRVKKIQGSKISNLFVYSNISKFAIPVHVYDGRLKMVFPNSAKLLDFGTLGVTETRELTFTLRNDNPVNVTVKELYPTSHLTRIELMGVEEGNHSLLTRPPDKMPSDTRQQLLLRPNHFAVYKINLTAPLEEGIFSVDIRVQTMQDGFYVPIRFQTSEGSVKSIPEKMVFEKAFPTKIPFKVLKIRSSFHQYTEVTKVSFMPPDDRFHYEPTKNTPCVLEPFQDTVIGMIHFDAGKVAKNMSYAGLLLNSPAGINWAAGLSLHPNTTEIDAFLFRRFLNRWKALESRRSINVTVKIDTEVIKGFLFQLEAHLTWPRLIRKYQDPYLLEFPITQIGNLSTLNMVVENPSDSNVHIQIIPLAQYPFPDRLLEEVTKIPQLLKYKPYLDFESDVFSLQNLEKYNKKKGNPVSAFRRNVKNATGVYPHPDSIATTLAPGVSVSVMIGFTPTHNTNYTSLVVIRNNLSVIDVMVVRGMGARTNLVVEEALEIEEGELYQLPYHIKDSVIDNCSQYLQDDHKPAFYKLVTPFTIYNDGELPLYIDGFLLNGRPCRYGAFVVNNCDPIVMAPHTTQRINMEYTPDFATNFAFAHLTILAKNGLTSNYTVTVQIPTHALARCRSSLPRPNWEQQLVRIFVVTMIMLFPVLILLAYNDTRMVFQDNLKEYARMGNGTERFDLRKVGQDKHTTPIQTSGKQTNQSTNSGGGDSGRRRKIDSSAVLNNGSPAVNGKSERRSQKNVQTVGSTDNTSGSPTNQRQPKSGKLKGQNGMVQQRGKLDGQKNNQLYRTNSSPPVISEKINNNTTSENLKSLNNQKKEPPIQASEGKHDHKNNLLKRNNSTSVQTDEQEVERTNEALPEDTNISVDPATSGNKVTLSDEAKLKLKRNSKAQLKRQSREKSTKPEIETKPKSEPSEGVENVRKSKKTSGTKIKEENETNSTSTGTEDMPNPVITADGKRMSVQDWLRQNEEELNAYADSEKEEDAWSTSPSNSQPNTGSDCETEASEQPDWDPVCSGQNDDLSLLSDQTQQFADDIQPPVNVLGPIGRPPSKPATNSGKPDYFAFPASSVHRVNGVNPMSSAPPFESMGFAQPPPQPQPAVTLMTQYQRIRERERQLLQAREMAAREQRQYGAVETVDDWHANIPGSYIIDQSNAAIWNSTSMARPSESSWQIPSMNPLSSIWGSSGTEQSVNVGLNAPASNEYSLFEPSVSVAPTQAVWSDLPATTEPSNSESLWSYQPPENGP